jgi:hypothetical protein
LILRSDLCAVRSLISVSLRKQLYRKRKQKVSYGLSQGVLLHGGDTKSGQMLCHSPRVSRIICSDMMTTCVKGRR